VIDWAKLKSRTAKQLAAIAKRKGVSGWHSMRKQELIKALAKLASSAASSEAGVAPAQTKLVKRNGAGRTRNGRHGAHSSGHHKAKAAALRRLQEIHQRMVQAKDLSYQSGQEDNGRGKDRLVVMVRDPFWLHANWKLTRASVERIRVALGQRWHEARPVLRVAELMQDGTTSMTRKIVRDIEIHGGVNNWYVDVTDPPRTFQMDIGYLAPDGRFLSLARSNVVTTPRCVAGSSLDGNWAEIAEDFDRVFTLSGGYSERGDTAELKEFFEERLRRPMGSPMVTRFGLGAGGAGRMREFNLRVDAELVVYGVTDPDAHVTLRGEPVKIHRDGTFRMRMSLPDRRQVLPVVASSGDGMEQRTIVLAVEKNTKVMEPVTREPDA